MWRGHSCPRTPSAGNQLAPSSAAVRDLTFSISLGEVLGLVGESGSGKSLTSLAIMGLLPPGARTSGTITFQNGNGRPTNSHLSAPKNSAVFAVPASP